jgi:signal transduction histidine kinase
MKSESASILVVDDSRLIRKILTSHLEEEGYEVFVAMDGKVGLKLIERGTFDFILLDIVIPRMDGIQVLKIIRKKYSVTELPVIMVTSQDQSQDVVKALEFGANDYIVKPVDPSVVLARIKTHLKLKRSDEALKKYSKELEQSNRLKDLFIDIMGHDLLKPAEIARLSAEVALDEEEDSKKKKILKKIHKSNLKIIELIENSSMLAKLESGEKLEFSRGDLGEFLRSVVKEINDSAVEKNIEIKVRREESFPAMINPLIYDVFSNLIGYAVKYSPRNSTIEVTILSHNGNWKIAVSDQGKGIPDKNKDAIFDRFKRLEKGGVEGSGLDLAIVKRIVIAHNGRVGVKNNPGGGSLFFAEIPKA